MLSRIRQSPLLVCVVFLSMLPLSAQQAAYTLKPTPKTVAWGYYDAKVAPVLRVKSGDTVEIQTLITNSPKRLEEAGLAPSPGEQTLPPKTAPTEEQGPRRGNLPPPH